MGGGCSSGEMLSRVLEPWLERMTGQSIMPADEVDRSHTCHVIISGNRF